MKQLIAGIFGVCLTFASPTIATASLTKPLTAQEIEQQSRHVWANVHVYSSEVKDQDCYVLFTGTHEGQGHKRVTFLHAEAEGSAWELRDATGVEVRQDNTEKFRVAFSRSGEEQDARIVGYTSNPLVKSVQIKLSNGNRPLNLYDGHYFATLLTPSDDEHFVSVEGLDSSGRVIEHWKKGLNQILYR